MDFLGVKLGDTLAETGVLLNQFDNTLNAEAAGQVGLIHLPTSKNYYDIKSSSITQAPSCVIYQEMCSSSCLATL